MKKSKWLFVGLVLIVVGCGDNEMFIFKLLIFLCRDFLEYVYWFIDDDCFYIFEFFIVYMYRKVFEGGKMICYKDIDFGVLNGIIFFFYIDMVNLLKDYVNYVNDKVEDYKVKVDKIEDL